MTEDERALQRAKDIKERNRDRIEDEGMMLHMMFMSAAMASGSAAAKADNEAERAMGYLKSRFT